MNHKLIAALAALIVLGLTIFALHFLSDEAGEEGKRDQAGVDSALQDHMASATHSREGGAEEAGDAGAGAPNPAGEDDLEAIGGGSTIRVRGRVLNVDGVPVENVTVESFEVKQIGYGLDPPRDAEWTDSDIRTESDGRFAIDLPRGLEPLTYLRFVHPGFMPQTSAIVAAVKEYDGSLRLDDVVLKKAYFIEGIVVDRQGDPAAGCAVSAPGMSWDGTIRWSLDGMTLTDSDGRFRLVMRDNEPIRVAACHDELGIGWTGEVVPGPGSDVPEVRIALQRSGSIAGRLLDSGGAPAAGRRIGVRAEIADLTIERFCAAGDDGGFRFDPLPDAMFEVFVKTIGIAGNVGNREDLVLAESVATGTHDLVLSLPLASRIALHLRNEAGEVVDVEPKIGVMQYVKMEAGEDSTTHFGFTWSGRIENPEPGTFVFGGFEQGTYYLNIRVEGYATCRDIRTTVPPPPESGEVVVKLSPRRAIEGKVNFSDGRAARGICVACEAEDDYYTMRGIEMVTFISKGIRGRIEQVTATLQVTDESGAFHFDKLRSTGRYALFFSVDGLEIHREWPVEITDEKPRAVLSITLPEASGSIAGSVLDPNGTPLPGAFVLAWNGEEFFYKCRSDEEGRYRFDGLLDGAYIVDARILASTGMSPLGASHTPLRKGFEVLDSLDAFNAVVSGGGVCRLDLVVADPWNSTITGRIDPGRQPFPGNMYVSISTLRPEHEDRELRRPTAADLFHRGGGTGDQDPSVEYFRFSHLPVGCYYVTVRWGPDQGIKFSTDPIDIGPSMTHEMIIPLGLVGLEGRIVDGATGAGVEGARIFLKNETVAGGSRDCQIVSGPEGEFSCRHVPAGKYDLFVCHELFAPHLTRGFLLDEGGDRAGVRIELEPGCGISGRLKFADIPDGDEQPEFKYYYVQIECPETGQYWPRIMGRVNRDGTFSLMGLPRGEVNLLVNGRGAAEVEHTVTLPAPKHQEIVIEVPRESAP